ncbi:cap-specific mRNA (nucleoside-2'-O-)-methyltransferase 1 isoform X2 [Cimex lectularius]|uniref:Cap-specific mRNA (nucleoside-2'-O-)-methyltransferase 1 n=1 Tax=Cimex lectularius TaxID=79782 RepID=A0A8I6RYI5_CIMLE|nr:cap-specific mRNA (nucleoside-2'-O-)-methyltransferase 1 isoform X2 [Cimex lectularius]
MSKRKDYKTNILRKNENKSPEKYRKRSHHLLSDEGQSSDEEKLTIDFKMPTVVQNEKTYEDYGIMSNSSSGDESAPQPDNYEIPADSGKDDSIYKNCSFESENESADDFTGDQPSCSSETSMPKKKCRILDINYVTDQPLSRENKGHLLLEKMGYKLGDGLGKHGQGRTEPIEMSNQKGRRGLGLSIQGLEQARIAWDESIEVVEAKESCSWLCGNHLGPLNENILSDWKTIGPKDLSIENMTDFCDEEILKKILEGKTIFDHLSEGELMKARSKCNPFETLKKAIFLNRAALKMANIDAAFDFMFTSPTFPNKQPMVGSNELLYFADVCAGPGGFSEYVLWKKNWRAKGIGFTLKGDNDFDLSKFYAGCPLTFEPYYGVKGDGDIYNPGNITSLTEFVMDVTDNKGVHFMMADGGFSVEGQENIQELLSKQLYLCQCLVALSIVRPYGHFVCKLFDLFSPFSAGLVYLMYRSFDKICIFKPNTSRPANSERYIVCKHKRKDCGPIRDYLFKLNEELFAMGSRSETDITHIVPMLELTCDKQFYNYLTESNNSLGERQVINLLKIKSFCQDPNLIERRQNKLRTECLNLWNIPNTVRSTNRMTPEEIAYQIIDNYREHLNFDFTKLVAENMEKSFKNLYDWQCFALASEKEQTFYIGDGILVYEWNFKRREWKQVTKCDIRLNPGTLVFGEIIYEIQGEYRKQKQIKALHVIDGISIGFEKISSLPFHKRLAALRLYEQAIRKKNEQCNFRVKIPFPMEKAEDIFKRLTVRNSHLYKIQLLIEEKEYWYEPRAVLFVNTMKWPWIRSFSKTSQCHYNYNICTTQSLFDYDCRENEVYGSTLDCLKNTLIWQWEQGVGLKKEGRVEGVVHKDDIIKHINQLLRPKKN